MLCVGGDEAVGLVERVASAAELHVGRVHQGVVAREHRLVRKRRDDVEIAVRHIAVVVGEPGKVVLRDNGSVSTQAPSLFDVVTELLTDSPPPMRCSTFHRLMLRLSPSKSSLNTSSYWSCSRLSTL